MSPLTVHETLDWRTFHEQHWDRRPVLFKQVADPPFLAEEVFRAAVAATRPHSPFALPAHVQFTVGRCQQTEPGEYLPEESDATFDGYRKRLATVLEGARYALVVHSFHSFHAPQWLRERAFYEGLWREAGQPLTGAITTLFHGNYEHSPVGVHRDRFATFMYVLRGRKRMRFWPQRPWDEPVSTVLDYDRFQSTSFAVVAEPGDLLYWPSSYYHVGESVDGPPATSVNVGVPREEHHAAYELDELLAGADEAPRGDPRADAARLPATTEAPFGPPDACTEPQVLPQALRALLVPSGNDVAPVLRGTAAASLRHWTSGGFRPVPPRTGGVPAPLPAALRAVADILWCEADGTILCAAHGHVSAIASHPAFPDVLRRLRTGAPVAVTPLLAPFPEAPSVDAAPLRGQRLPATREGVQSLLAELAACRALAPAENDGWSPP